MAQNRGEKGYIYYWQISLPMSKKYRLFDKDSNNYKILTNILRQFFQLPSKKCANLLLSLRNFCPQSHNHPTSSIRSFFDKYICSNKKTFGTSFARCNLVRVYEA